MMGQDSLCKYMYDMFVKKEYSYLHSLTGQATSGCAIMRMGRGPVGISYRAKLQTEFFLVLSIRT